MGPPLILCSPQACAWLPAIRGFSCQVLPDSGCSMSLIPGWLATKHKLEVDTESVEDIALFNTSNEEMKILGTARIWVIPDTYSKPRLIEGLVSPGASWTPKGRC